MKEPLETLHLGPTDRLVVVWPSDTSRLVLDEERLALPEPWRDSVLFVVGADQLAVLRGETP